MEFSFEEESFGTQEQQSASGNEMKDMLKLLLNNQSEVLANQRAFINRLDSFDKRLSNLESGLKENKIEASEQLTQSKTLRECKVLLRRVHSSICKITGEEVDELQTEIAAILPFQTLASAKEFEAKLGQQEYLEAMKIFLLRLKGKEGTVDDLLRRIYSDDFLSFCNWGGRGEKEALSQFSIAGKILYDVFQVDGRDTYEENIRTSIRHSHSRFKQRNYRQRTSKNAQLTNLQSSNN